jgi:spermidine/putrescine transport system substrate-binding protein
MPKVLRLLAVLSALAVVGAACAEEGGGGGGGGGGAAPFPSSPPAAEDAGPLRLLEWAGYEIPEFHGPFSEAYPDVKLEYQFADAGSSFYQKVATGGVEVDLAHPCSNWVQTWYDAGLIAPIDVSRLEHWSELDPKMRELGKIGDQYYFVPWDWGYESLIVNTDMVKDVPQSWADLWDPQYKGLIAMEDFSEGAVAMTAWAFDLPYPNLSDEDLQFIKDKLIELKQNIKLFWAGSTDLVQAMVNGDVAIGYGWNDQFAKVVDGGVNAVYVDPEEGRGGWVCGFVVLKDTPHYDLALKYIDSAISPEVGKNAIDMYFLGHSNTKSVELADPKTVEMLGLLDTDVQARTNFAVPLTAEQRDRFNQIWSEVLAA